MPRISAVLVLCLSIGCTKSTPAELDASIMFEVPDSGFDAGPPPSVIGNECAADVDCGDGSCFTEMNGFAGGYCTSFCVTDDECPMGSVCVMGGSGGNCFDVCDPAATERDCRAYYGCASGFGLPMPVCLPGCTDDTDCPTDRICNPTGGGRCFDPTASLGDPCVASSDCPDGGGCASERRSGYPGGMCIGFGCDEAANTGCPGDFQCAPGPHGSGRCLDGCAVDTDCRDGYACLPMESSPDRLVCAPACTSDTQCTDGRTCDTAAGTCG